MTPAPKLTRFTERDFERALLIFDARDLDGWPGEGLGVENLAEVYMDERERFLKIVSDYAFTQRARGFEVRARAAEEIADLIRADRGGP